MGITGLLPFLDKSSKRVNVSEFPGCTVAIDSYCWLHKGAFSCADKIVMGQKTDAYVKYCMKFVNMLLSYKIKPILVFDGRHLPAKAETEVKRRESREANRKRAAELIKMGKDYEGKNLLKRSLDVSHKMALELIKECQAHNVDCIVAPYEADAQLAYLNVSGIADIVITEDSDLTLFGCKKILFKMDLCGNGILIEQERLYLSMDMSSSDFSMDKFLYMCILSGCDYLPSLPGIGLVKARKFIARTTDTDIYNALQRLPYVLNMKTLNVGKEYRDAFLRALFTFKHQLVYDPLTRSQVRLNSPTLEVTNEHLKYAGEEIEPKLAYQLALGNCDPFSFKRLHDFDPDNIKPRSTNAWSETSISPHRSIWSKNYKIQNKCSTPKKDKIVQPKAHSHGKVVVLNTERIKKQITPKKRNFEETILSDSELVQMYGGLNSDPVVNSKEIEKNKSLNESENESAEEQKSPIIVKRSNPFKKTDSNEISPSLISKVRKRLPVKRSTFRTTVIDENNVTKSSFFTPKPNFDIQESEEQMEVTESMVPNFDPQEYRENMDISQISNNENISQLSKSSSEIDREDSGVKGLNFDICNPKNSSPETKTSYENTDKDLEKTTSSDVDNGFEEISEELMDFSVSSNHFSEVRSSLFKYEYSVPEKKLKHDINKSKNSNQLKSSMQGSRRSSITNKSKKNNTIQGQQSLKMFGFQKKSTLKH